MNNFDVFFDTFFSTLKEFFDSRFFGYFAIFGVLLFVVSVMRFILRGFESPYCIKPVKEEKQIFSEDDIS